VTLLQSADTILTQFDEDLAKKALDNLSRTGVDVRTKVRVIEGTEKHVGKLYGMGIGRAW
jgi:NADH dehydrogenase FAD-containing subunit